MLRVAALALCVLAAVALARAQSASATAGANDDATGDATALPSGPVEDVTVTASRAPHGAREQAVATTVVGRDDLAAAAAPVADAALQQVPGFTLFRRTDSRFANPTAQGVSLRGSGASGASRALVLADGVPLNDPFGGWVHWGRVPLLAIARVEVARGGLSDLYGSSAMGGVVQVVRREPSLADARPFARAEASWGTLDAPEGGLAAGASWNGWTGAVAAQAFRTGGYVPVPTAERGPVDRPLETRQGAFEVSLGHAVGADGRVFVRGSRFEDHRVNGTVLQGNDTAIRGFSAGLDATWRGARWSVRAWHERERYGQTFSNVSDDRAVETLTRTQLVPSRATGTSVAVDVPLGRRAWLAAGVDAQQVSGTSDELAARPGPTAHAASGGTQRTGAAFVELGGRAASWLAATVSVRADRWTNRDGRRSTGPAGEPFTTASGYPDRSASATSPRVGIVLWPDAACAPTAAAYRAFRAPTLNELYRPFQVGSALTLANPDLGAERLAGAEAGLRCRSRDRALGLAVTGFVARIADPVANVTIGDGLRQRRNLGATRSRGAEIEADARLGGRWAVRLGVLFDDPRVTYAPGQPQLVGLTVAQVPRRAALVGVSYAARRGATLNVDARWTGAQYEDDLDLVTLRGGYGVDASWQQPLGDRLVLFAAVENVLGDRWDVGRTPVTTLGPPRQARIALRWDWDRP